MARIKKSRIPTGEDSGILQVGRGARLAGKLEGKGVVLACGELQGELDLDGELIVTVDGKVDVAKGRARLLSVEGEAAGRFRVQESLELKKGAVFRGEIETQRLDAAPGSRLEASLRIGKAPEEK